MRMIMMIFYSVLMLLTVCFAALNANNVLLNIYFMQFNLPLSVLMIAALILGIMIGSIIFFGRYLQLKKQYRKVTQQLKLTEKEIKNIRTMPLKD